MNIKGEYRDVIKRNGRVIKDFGWRSNKIVADFGKFLAALMKKDFERKEPVGIEYIAVGSGSADEEEFKVRIGKFFGDNKIENNGYWVWAKSIDEINYAGLPEGEEISNAIRIEMDFQENEPEAKTFELREFALVGIGKKEDDTDKVILDVNRLFLINYVSHGPITKDKDMTLSRTINLTFPINNNQGGVQ